jgi:hypothetical protein
MEECAGIAEVIRVTKHPVIEIAEGVEVGGSTIPPECMPLLTNTHMTSFL